MLESGDILKTWRLDTPPECISNKPAAASRILDHNLKFLTYEGPVNQGFGSVRIVDTGAFDTLEENEKKIRINFYGKILLGEFVLETLDPDQWRFYRTK